MMPTWTPSHCMRKDSCRATVSIRTIAISKRSHLELGFQPTPSPRLGRVRTIFFLSLARACWSHVFQVWTLGACGAFIGTNNKTVRNHCIKYDGECISTNTVLNPWLSSRFHAVDALSSQCANKNSKVTYVNVLSTYMQLENKFFPIKITCPGASPLYLANSEGGLGIWSEQ